MNSGVISWKMAFVLLLVNAGTLAVLLAASTLVHAAPPTNRRIRVIGQPV